MPQTLTSVVTTPELAWVTEPNDDVLIDPPDNFLIDPDGGVVVTLGADEKWLSSVTHENLAESAYDLNHTHNVTSNVNVISRSMLLVHTADVSTSITNSGQETCFEAITNKNSAGTVNRINGIRGQVSYNAGSATNVFGFSGVNAVAGGTITTSTGISTATNITNSPTITTNRGIFVGAITGGTGTVTTNYGVFVQDSNYATNEWAFYAPGPNNDNYFGGIVFVGTSSGGGTGALRVYQTSGVHIQARSAGGTYEITVDNSSGDVTVDATAGKMILETDGTGVQIGTLTGAAVVKRIAEESVTISSGVPASVAANSTSTFTYTMAASTVDTSTRVFVSMRSAMDSGLTWDYTYNASTRVLTMRYHNVTTSSVTVTTNPTIDILKVQF